MQHDLIEECIVCALSDLDYIKLADKSLERNEHAAEAERHLRLLRAEINDANARVSYDVTTHKFKQAAVP